MTVRAPLLSATRNNYRQPVFFQSSYNNEGDEENEVAVEQAESILDSVSSHDAFRTRRLRWHYRSRHESLIAFSNKHFYDSDLVLFPSPMEKADDLGIRFTKVNGCFENSRNVAEAQAIVRKALEILATSPDESIGMVAMNSQQRDEIEMQFEQQLREYPHLQDLVDEKAKTDPVFIKNLENVQGDERNVILISMTYGPQTIGGKVRQNFGSINRADGWRRLNVLFTRAKKRMHIFSSMSSWDVLVSETSSRGVKALNAFLEYCECGHLHQAVITGKAPDSDFEIAVINALAKHGYQCEPQVGVNGFFLDIAVRNPNRPQQFLIGVECDGATYHSAKSARDRDRLRQEILEGLGWEIHRIWSTDWFKNPEAALMPILNRLEVLKQKYPCQEGNDDTSPPQENSPVEPVEMVNLGLDLNQVEPENFSSEQDNDEIASEPIEPKNLKEHLQILAARIEVEHPDVPAERRILRPAMIEVLIHSRPTSREAFLSRIPAYLRENIASSEGAYLDEIFRLIARF
ncbi:very-short-patch-repair endonuclease [Neisseria perflava]|uniref:AAA domain-containing protein n=1 Tax=Neisseria perflava TaxID=33053 RepID=UPI00209D8D42|nr:AAA domain-containing protein [Neisseria perflava]MCP1772749.1 very-short-patch-repair endonuclease [Neisseria perflava]